MKATILGMNGIEVNVVTGDCGTLSGYQLGALEGQCGQIGMLTKEGFPTVETPIMFRGEMVSSIRIKYPKKK